MVAPWKHVQEPSVYGAAFDAIHVPAGFSGLFQHVSATHVGSPVSGSSPVRCAAHLPATHLVTHCRSLVQSVSSHTQRPLNSGVVCISLLCCSGVRSTSHLSPSHGKRHLPLRHTCELRSHAPVSWFCG